jgi:hypothetical protein
MNVQQSAGPLRIIRNHLTVEQETHSRRLLDFLHEVKPVGHVSYFLNPNSRPRFSHFSLVSNTMHGIEFKDFSYTRDGSPHFFVPGMYLDDPDEWERSVLATMEYHRAKALKGVLKYFGGDVSVDEFTMDVVPVQNDRGKTILKVRLHPGMKDPSNEKLRDLLSCKGILAVPSINIPV